jgi:hypothetical protein
MRVEVFLCSCKATVLLVSDSVPVRQLSFADNHVFNKKQLYSSFVYNFMLISCSFQVIACHDFEEGSESKLCSERAMASARTLPNGIQFFCL